MVEKRDSPYLNRLSGRCVNRGGGMLESGVKTKSGFILFTAVCFENEGLISGHLRIIEPSVFLRRFRCHGIDLTCPLGKFDRENFPVGLTDRV